jgi:hypothetical protein
VDAEKCPYREFCRWYGTEMICEDCDDGDMFEEPEGEED